MIDHAYVIDLSKDWQPSLKGVFFSENAPTFLCISSPHHAADGMNKYSSYKPVPGAAERRAEAAEKREVNRKIQEAIRDEARSRKKEQDARDKALRAKLSAMRKADDIARRKAEDEAKRKKRAEQMIANAAAARSAKRIIKKPKAKRVRGPKKIYDPVPEGYVSQAQAARESGRKENTISLYVKSGAIPCEKRGRFTYVRVADVTAEHHRRMAAWHARNLAFGQRRREEMRRQKTIGT